MERGGEGGAEGGGGGSSSLRTRACAPTGEASAVGERRRAFFARSHSICSPPCFCGGNGDDGVAVGAGGGGGGSVAAAAGLAPLRAHCPRLVHRGAAAAPMLAAAMAAALHLAAPTAAAVHGCTAGDLRFPLSALSTRREVPLKRGLPPCVKELAESVQVCHCAPGAICGGARLTVPLASV